MSFLYLKEIKELTLDLLFPEICAGCGKEGNYICDDCRIFSEEAPLICPVCNKSNFNGQKHTNCSARYGLDGLVSIWNYEGVTKKLVNNIKYKRVFHAIPEFTKRGIEVMVKDTPRFQLFLSFFFSKETKIVYVPIYRKKERLRGFNQAALIAKILGEIIDKEISPLLVKTKNTLAQANLDKEERMENVRDVFNSSAIDADSYNIIIVDDVWTTGATMRECCKVLKKAGAKKVWGFTLARTV